MKLCLKIFAIATIAAFTYSLIGCAAPAGFSYQNISITLNQFCTYTCSSVTYDPNTIPPLSTGNNQYAWEIASGTYYFFTANVVNAPANFTWALYPTENLIEPADTTGNGTGEASAGATDGAFYVGPDGTGPTVIYIPPSPPIFSGAALQQAQNFQYTTSYTRETLSVNGVPSLQTITAAQTGIPMGDILLAVSVPSNPVGPTQNYTYYQLMEITGGLNTFLIPSTPTNPSGLTTPAVTVPRGHLLPVLRRRDREWALRHRSLLLSAGNWIADPRQYRRHSRMDGWLVTVYQLHYGRRRMYGPLRNC